MDALLYSKGWPRLMKGTLVRRPSTGVVAIQIKIIHCLVNRTHESEGRSTAGAYAIWQWLKQHHPKVALHPHKVDYRDSCKHMEMELTNTPHN